MDKASPSSPNGDTPPSPSHVEISLKRGTNDRRSLSIHSDLSGTDRSRRHTRTGSVGGSVDPVDSGKERRTLDIIYEFLVTTSAHGWGHVARGFNYPIKSIWLVVTLAAFTINVIHVFVLVAQYLKFPYEQVTEVEVASVEFPSITVCNLQPMSMSSAAAMNANASTRFHKWNNITKHFFDELEKKHPPNNSSQYEYEYEMMYDRLRGPRGFFENIGGEEVEAVGHRSEDLVVHCTFAKELCHAQNMTRYISADFYSCYTFNGIAIDERSDNSQSVDNHLDNGNFSTSTDAPTVVHSAVESQSLFARSTGPDSGLSLTLYLETDNGNTFHEAPYYGFENTGNSAGIRVTVHAPRTRPNPIDFGFDVPPGFSSSVGLSITSFKRLDLPYGRCLNEQKMKAIGAFRRYQYSASACLMGCQQTYVMERCRCLSAALPLPENIPMPSPMSESSKFPSRAAAAAAAAAARSDTSTTKQQYTFCGQLDPQNPSKLLEQTKCEATAMKEFTTNENIRNECKCEAPCHENTYRRETSYAYWPADLSQGTFYQKYVLNSPHRDSMKSYLNLRHLNVSELIEKSLIRKNFVRLNVYIQSLVIDEVVQKGSYTFFNLFSDIGGTFGLWIGMSLLTWGEVAELILHLSYRWVTKFRRR